MAGKPSRSFKGICDYITRKILEGKCTTSIVSDIKRDYLVSRKTAYKWISKTKIISANIFKKDYENIVSSKYNFIDSLIETEMKKEKPDKYIILQCIDRQIKLAGLEKIKVEHSGSIQYELNEKQKEELEEIKKELEYTINRAGKSSVRASQSQAMDRN